MDLFRISLLLRSLIILKLFSGTSTLIFPKPSDGPVKSIICVVENGDTNIQEIPSQCTCLASYSSNTKTSADQIQTLRKDLQYLLIIDNYEYETIKGFVTTDKITGFINEICDSIKKFRANGVLFDRMNSDGDDGKTGDPNGPFQQGVQKLFRELRKKNDGLVIGLGLSRDEDILSHAFTQKFIGPDVDFFVATTLIYRDCTVTPIDFAALVTIVDPQPDIEGTLDMMQKQGFTYDKLIFIIRIVVQSAEDNDKKNYIETSYADMCSENHKFSVNRFFCTEELPNFYSKGKIVQDRKMKGVIFQPVDNDDFSPNCGTHKFPALQAVKAGVDGKPEPKDVTGEKNWATTS